MAKPFRVFQFPIGTPMPDRLRLIRAALADEGLGLGGRSGAGDMVTSVIHDGVCDTRVPSSRIWSLEAVQSYFDSLPPRHAFVPDMAEGSTTCAAPCGEREGHPVHRLREEAST